MRLFELADTSYSYNIKSQSEDLVKYSFTTENNFLYVVTFSENPNNVIILFTANTDPTNPWGDSTDKTGSGNAFKIFSTIKKIFEEYLLNKSPEGIMFAAHVIPSRIKLYDKFAQYIEQNYPYIQKESTISDKYKIYKFLRK